jgi:hypothetical protein
MMLTAPGFDRLIPCMQRHGCNPGTDREKAIYNSAFNQSLKWRPQYLEEIVKKHTRDVIAHHEHSPSDYSGGEHLYGTIVEAHDWDQGKDYKQAAKDRISFQSPIIEPGHAIGSHQSRERHDY